MSYKKYDKKLLKKLLKFSSETTSYRRLRHFTEKSEPRTFFRNSSDLKSEVLKELANNSGKGWNEVYMLFFDEITQDSSTMWNVLFSDRTDNKEQMIKNIATCIKKNLKNK